MSTVHMDAAPAPNPEIIRFNPNDRRHFIGGSDARIIMGDDQDRLIRLWREKRGEVEPEDLSDNLIVQLGTATEDFESRLVSALNRTDHHGCPEARSASHAQMDGGNARRHG